MQNIVTNRLTLTFIIHLCVILILSLLYAQDGQCDDGSLRESYSEPSVNNIPRRVFFGDLHLHTNNSADAYALDNVSFTPADAYRFARDGVTINFEGENARLRRPLDFLAVTDHSEFMGVFVRLLNEDPTVLGTKAGLSWTKKMKVEGVSSFIFNAFSNLVGYQSGDKITERLPSTVAESVWQSVVQTADLYNDPGRFTTFSGYEWSSMPLGSSLHRVVLFKDSADKVLDTLPYTTEDSADPEGLWRALETYEKKFGGEVIAIPHNGNLSRGKMFSTTRLNGKPFDKEYIKKRAKWEPLYEVTQSKGTSEVHPFLAKTDEFANFELWDDGGGSFPVESSPERLRYEYARSALGIGIEIGQKQGDNPYKFGLIGSSDIHTSLSTTAEDNFFGKFPESAPNERRSSNHLAGSAWANWRLSSSGLTAIWAHENTREALFDAMIRKEVYATTGSRIKVRFFGGWDFTAKDLSRPNYADIGYKKGVPMGADLSNGPKDRAPSFLIIAAKDPDGANLDRIQIIKGWIDVNGQNNEKIYNVALSDGREVDLDTGKAPSVGSTVNLDDATYSNTIGSAYLSGFWTDPHFDSSQHAFYYARVLEIPVPRWTAYDASYFSIERSPNIPMTIQDRAFTSPIWYTPN